MENVNKIFFTGDPGFQQGVGADINVNQSTVSRTLVTVSEAIC